jgi:hypothetical protein
MSDTAPLKLNETSWPPGWPYPTISDVKRVSDLTALEFYLLVKQAVIDGHRQVNSASADFVRRQVLGG